MTLALSADSLEELEAQLDHIIFELSRDDRADDGRIMSSVSGGYSSGHICIVDVDKKMTGEIYRERLKEYIAKKKASK